MSLGTYFNLVKSSTMKRLRRLKNFMEVKGLSALILFEDDPIAYKLALTNHFNVVLILSDELYVFTDATLYYEALNESPWSIVLIENFTLDELTRKLLSLLERHEKIERLVVGVNKAWGRTKVSFLYADLINALRARGIDLADATELLTYVFDKPFDEELAIVKWISDAASQALEAVEETLKPGMREYEVAAIADRVLSENGIVDRWFTTIVASGPRASSPHAKTSIRKIVPGDPVVVDLGPLWMGYDGCVAHTFIVGRNNYWNKVLGNVIDALRVGLEHAKPGVPVKVLDEIPRGLLKKRGYPDYPHLTGHPIGGFYRPVIASFIDYSLEPGMVFAYEPAIYIPGRGGIRIEPHILVSNQGYDILTEYHKKFLK